MKKKQSGCPHCGANSIAEWYVLPATTQHNEPGFPETALLECLACYRTFPDRRIGRRPELPTGSSIAHSSPALF